MAEAREWSDSPMRVRGGMTEGCCYDCNGTEGLERWGKVAGLEARMCRGNSASRRWLLRSQWRFEGRGGNEEEP